MNVNINLIISIFNLPFSNYLPGFIRKKLLKNNKITFIPTHLKSLPKKNYPVLFSQREHEKIYQNYIKTNKISFNTFEEIKIILNKKYKKEEHFNFLDFGGEKIDFYLNIVKEFKNINYFIINLPQINKDLQFLKEKYNLQNIFILKNLDELKSKNFDFVYFGSTIQYIDNYTEVLNNLLPLIKKHIFFSATHFFEKNDKIKNIVVKQLNYLPVEYHLYFINLDNFLVDLAKFDFEVQFNQINKTYKYNTKVFKNFNLNNLKYTDIFFEKKINFS